MINNPYQKYKKNSVTTATPGELTLMLYNGCIKFIKLAKRALVEQNMQDKNTNIQKAQNVIRELMITLNIDIPISQQMMTMYEYINHRLMEANIQNDSAVLDEVEGYVVEFRDTWKQVIQVNKQGVGTTGTV
ncbi:flagellar export chaperone FliS [Bacillus fonticola]|uniref:flagellar export chaperone FliS n=1 Tax=Bacillus fonticola TaxID=2728853 RepID=UPI001472C322|nr:flagellar export chaperone FliS [Bacillus fonticola]